MGRGEFMERTDLHFAPKDEALREDVGVLGALVGHMLREQGAGLYELVEEARRAAIRRREHEPAAEAELRSLLGRLEAAEATELVRAFSTYFQVVNLAERIHRIRRRREYLVSADAPQPASMEESIERLREHGFDFPAVRQLLTTILVEPVFTAHPTEATRGTVLRKEQRIARCLIERLNPGLTPEEHRSLLARIRSEVASAWQTNQHPVARMSVADEREHVLFYLANVIYRVVPDFYSLMSHALEKSFGRAEAAIDLPVMLRFASWVGGDMDGNPNVTAATIEATLRRQREVALGLYIDDLAALADQLSQSDQRVAVDAAITAGVRRYAGMFPEVVTAVQPRHADMPYRIFLRLVSRRLEATRDDEEGRYPQAESFCRDLECIEASLRHNHGQWAGAYSVHRLLLRARTFGFHLATLDIRQDALVHRELIGRALGDERWLSRTAEARLQRLRQAWQSGEGPGGDFNAAAEPVMAVFATIASALDRYGPSAVGPYIISMTQGADDLLSVLLLARWSGLQTRDGSIPIDVAPLFETVPDLRNGPEIMSGLFADELYRTHLQQRENRQVIMVGYSDSNKEGGLAAARWAIQLAQERLAAAASAAELAITIFHGRGGTVSRGGGKVHQAVLAAPPGTAGGHLRMTEQGEIINAKYGLRGIALRTLERSAGALALATAGVPPAAQAPDVSWREAMQTMAGHSRAAYRALVYQDRRFPAYFRSATPIDVIERMQIGSRPASRRSGEGVENLRAIPWVFAWTQTRQIVPGWFGVGTGLEAAVQAHGESRLREMAARWLFFRNLLADVEMVLAKADMEIGARYAGLSDPGAAPCFDIIRDEFERTVRVIKRLRGSDELLEADPTLQRAIRLRNPYVDPMSLLQVDLLVRWRASGRNDKALLEALLATVNGIAQGLQNTG